MSDAVLARRYAKAFFDLAASQSKVVKFQDQLHWLSRAMQVEPDLQDVLANQRLPLAKRLAIVDQIGKSLQLDLLTVHFVQILVEKNRIDCWVQIVEAFTKLAAKMAGVVRAEVTTAVPLENESITAELNAVLERLTKKTVNLSMAVDDAIIGGAVVRIDDTIYDGSLATDLRRLRDRLNEALIA